MIFRHLAHFFIEEMPVMNVCLADNSKFDALWVRASRRKIFSARGATEFFIMGKKKPSFLGA